MQSQAFVAITGLNNKVENRLVSIASGLTQLDGEANLTFDGSVLTVTGDTTITGTVTLAGAALTSTAAELNILDGVTSSTAELNILTGLTGSVAELNILDGVTSSTAEINLLDADGFIVNDGGIMKTIPASDVKTYASGGGAAADSENTILHMQLFA